MNRAQAVAAFRLRSSRSFKCCSPEALARSARRLAASLSLPRKRVLSSRLRFGRSIARADEGEHSLMVAKEARAEEVIPERQIHRT